MKTYENCEPYLCYSRKAINASLRREPPGSKRCLGLLGVAIYLLVYSISVGGCAKHRTPNYDISAVYAVRNTIADDGTTIGAKIENKGSSYYWETRGIYASDNIEQILGFPVLDYSKNAYIVFFEKEDSPWCAEWVVFWRGASPDNPVVFPLNKNANDIQGISKLEKHKQKYASEIAKLPKGQKYDASFDPKGNFKVGVITPYEFEIFKAVEAEFETNPEPSPRNYRNDESWANACDKIEKACLRRVGDKYGLNYKTVLAIYGKVGLLKNKYFEDI